MDGSQVWLVVKLKLDPFNISLLHPRDKEDEPWLVWF